MTPRAKTQFETRSFALVVSVFRMFFEAYLALSKSQANALLAANYLWSLINQVEWVAQ